MNPRPAPPNTNHQLMKKTNTLHRWLLLTLATFVTGAQAAPVPAHGKLKVFILTGQSNIGLNPA